MCEQEEEMEYDFRTSYMTLQEGDTKPWESKLGGCPYLKKKEEYPIGENGKPMLFLAQINCGDLNGMPMLPDHGLLQFFVQQDDMFGEGADPLVRWIEEVQESEDGLLTEHPYDSQEYREALPFETPGKMFFDKAVVSDEDDEECRIGGYPCFVQDGDMEPCEFLLLQLSDQAECGVCFGDCGVCYFILDRKELEARDFSHVSYGWQCS